MEQKKPAPPPIVEADVETCYELYRKAIDYIYTAHAAVGKPAHIFMSQFIQNLRFVPTNAERIPLCGVVFSATKHFGTFFYNPLNCKNMDVGQWAGSIVHEISHILLDHYKEVRVIKALGMLANIAFDMEVWELVRQMGYVTPTGPLINSPEGMQQFIPWTVDNTPALIGLQDPNKFPLHDQDWQYYLKWLLENMPPEMQEFFKQQGQNPNPTGDPAEQGDPGDDEGDDEGAGREANVNNAVARAAEAAGEDKSMKGIGKLNQHIESKIKALNPTTPWKKYFSEIFGNAGRPVQITRRRFNKHDTLGTISEQPKPAIAIVLDVSSSMSKKHVAMCLGESYRLGKLFEAAVIVQLSAYGKIGHRFMLDEEPKDLDLKTGGGTCMRPGVMSFLEGSEDDDGFENITPGAIIVLSDGLLGKDSIVTPQEAGDTPVYWAFTGRRDPFGDDSYAGKIIYLEGFDE